MPTLPMEFIGNAVSSWLLVVVVAIYGVTRIAVTALRSDSPITRAIARWLNLRRQP